MLVATEFGRAVAPNGTCGRGGAAFVRGGAVRGGRVLAGWPGLAKAQSVEGRDLRITTDWRAAIGPLLAWHPGLPPAVRNQTVLPGSAPLPALDRLRAGAG